MFLKHTIVTAIGFVLFPTVSWATENAHDARQQQAHDVLYLENIRSETDNPTAISYSTIDHSTDILIGYGYHNGDFVSIDKSAKVKSLLIDISGLKKMKRIAFEGGISYQNTTEKNRRWNTSLYIAPDNPFVLADSVGSDYSVEKFVLNGGFSWDALAWLKFGIKANYEVGSSADQTDPRPDTKGMRFDITPGLDFKLSPQINIGLSAGARLLNEETKYTNVVGTTNYDFFLMNGLGNYYLQNGTSYQRRYKGSAWHGNVQSVWTGTSGISNLLAIGMEKNSERAEDGGTQRLFLGGKYRSTRYDIADRLSIRRKSVAHNISLKASLHRNDGIWYDQKSISDNGEMTYWEVVNSSIKHKENRKEASISYRFDLLRHSVPTLTATANVGITQSETTNYPNEYRQKYSNVVINAQITKYTMLKKCLFIVSASGGYQSNLSASLYATGITLANQYTIPMFDYLTADAYTIAGKIEVKFPLSLKKFQSYLGTYIKSSTQRYVGDSTHYRDTAFNAVEGGLQFQF